MNDGELESELMSLSTAEIKRRIDDMYEFINDPSWSLQSTLGAEQYLPLLHVELASRGETYREDG